MLYALINQLSYCHKARHIQYVIDDAECLLSRLDMSIFIAHAINRNNELFYLICKSL